MIKNENKKEFIGLGISVIMFTYIIGVIISVLTKQINLSNYRQTVFLFILSACILTVSMSLIIKFANNKREVIEEIKKLEI